MIRLVRCQPGDPLYVDCREVRGDGDIVSDLGKRMRNSEGDGLGN